MALFLIHFAAVWKSSVNIPSDDEWAVLKDPTLMSFKWLFSQHNEHRIVTTKFLIWLQYQLNGWNHSTNLILNFLVYGVTLLCLNWIAKTLAPWIPVWIILSFNIFLLSPILWMNHLIGFQLCFHFWLLSFLLSSYLLFSSPQSWQRLIAGCLALLLSLYSLATGLASGLIVLSLFVLFKMARACSVKPGMHRTREILQLTIVIVEAGAAISLWFSGYETPENSRGLSFPYELSFWRLFLNLVSFGFGIDRISTWLGAISLLIVISPIIWQVVRQKGQLSSQQWTAYTMTVALLGTLAFVAMGRAAFGLEWSKTSRYAEIGMPLIMLSVVNWSWALRQRPRLKWAAVLCFWSFCLLAFSNNWSFDNYQQIAASRKIGRQCIQAYYQQGGNAVCPTLWPTSLSDQLDRARKLNMSFYREISAHIKTENQQTNTPATVQSYSGALDVANCRQIAGRDSNGTQQLTPLIIDIYDGDRVIGTGTADSFLSVPMFTNSFSVQCFAGSRFQYHRL